MIILEVDEQHPAWIGDLRVIAADAEPATCDRSCTGARAARQGDADPSLEDHQVEPARAWSDPLHVDATGTSGLERLPLSCSVEPFEGVEEDHQVWVPDVDGDLTARKILGEDRDDAHLC